MTETSESHEPLRQTPPKRRGASVRMRLLAIALLPTLVIMPLFFIVTAVNWSSRFDNLLIAKVNGELTIAQQYLSQLLENSDLRMQALAEGLAALPARQAQAVSLRHLEGLSNPEIAQIMDISVRSVESLTARGKRALADLLAGRKAELGYDDDTPE